MATEARSHVKEQGGRENQTSAPSPQRAPAPASTWRHRWLVLALTADTLTYAVAAIAAYAARFEGHSSYMIVRLVSDVRVHLPYVVALSAALPLWIAVFALARTYSWRRVSYPPFELRRILASAAVGTAMFGLLSFATRTNIARKFIAVFFVTSMIFTPLGRWLARAVYKWWRRRAGARAKTLIVGASREGRIVADIMLTNPTFDFVPVGFIDSTLPVGASPAPSTDASDDADYRATMATKDAPAHQLKVLGPTSMLLELVDALGISAVFFVDTQLSSEGLGLMLKALRTRDVEVRISANLPEILAWRLTIEPISGFPMLSVDAGRMERLQRFAKRSLDLAGSGLGLALLSPFLAIIALAIRLDSRGPVFYRQRRAGRDGRPFGVTKFRTMVVGADKMRVEGEIESEVAGPIFKVRDDPRVTRVGRLLRRYSIDELPQLFNVLWGQMSLVGPRPLPLDQQAAMDEIASTRLEVRPGITGLWQVSGRSDAPLERLIRLDQFYVENWSVAYDLYVLYKTIPAVLRKSGAY